MGLVKCAKCEKHVSSQWRDGRAEPIPHLTKGGVPCPGSGSIERLYSHGSGRTPTRTLHSDGRRQTRPQRTRSSDNVAAAATRVAIEPVIVDEAAWVTELLDQGLPAEQAAKVDIERVRLNLSLIGERSAEQRANSPALAAAVLSDPALIDTIGEGCKPTTLLAAIRPIAEWAANHAKVLSDLSGTTSYTDLSAEDYYLAACYCPEDSELERDLVGRLRKLNRKEEWALENLQKVLPAGQLFSTFLVRLQPRIAEREFGRVAKLLFGTKSPVDLNLRKLKANATWAMRKDWPAEDWEIPETGHKYDVKSNLYFRSQRDKVGLRGLFVNAVDVQAGERIAAFIFDDTDTGNSHCHWHFLGFLSKRRPQEWANDRHRRMAPFYFELPPGRRFDAGNLQCSAENARLVAQLARLILPDNSRPIIAHLDSSDWRTCDPLIFPLYLGQPLEDPNDSQKLVESEVCEEFKRLEGEGDKPAPERVLFEAATRGLFRLRNSGNSDTEVRGFLEAISNLSMSHWFPAALGELGLYPLQRSLLQRWVDDVLLRLNVCWDKIACPHCRRTTITSLEPSRMDSEGSIYGRIKCKCGNAPTDELTILTHCWKCGHYPLLIGTHRTCDSCQGLKCEWPATGGHPCGSCKHGCYAGPTGSREQDNLIRNSTHTRTQT